MNGKPSTICPNCQSEAHERCCERCGKPIAGSRLAVFGSRFCSGVCDLAQKIDDKISAKLERDSQKERDARTLIAVELLVQAYQHGFADGSNLARARRAHTVDASTHDEWMRGFDAGRTTAIAASNVRRQELLMLPRKLCGCPTTMPCTHAFVTNA